MREVYNNPDGDPLSYVLTCTNDGSVSFAHTLDKDQMIIEAGLKPGEYKVTIDVQGEKVTCDHLTLTVVNDFPRLTAEIKDLELWSDHYGFQDATTVVNTVDLNDYFTDPEMMPLSFRVETSVPGVVNVAENGGVLTFSTIEGVEEDVIITVTATDGITPDSVASTSFEVSVVSGKMVFWRQNWIYFAISGAILLAIIIFIIVLVKNKLVKGEWLITVDDCGETEAIPDAVDIAGFLSVGKKSKFKLVDLMNELALFLPGGWGLKITNYFSVPGADKLTLVGVTRRKGCDVTGIPRDNRLVRVNVNGMDIARGKAKLHSGTLTFVISKDDGTGDQLTITMTLQ